MKIGDKVTFEVMDAVENPPCRKRGVGWENVIAFVPCESFQSCGYFNGNKTWLSNITGKTVTPTIWLKKIRDDEKKKT